jgi:hypothetical protein
MLPGDVVPPVARPISAASCETKPEIDLEKRIKENRDLPIAIGWEVQITR